MKKCLFMLIIFIFPIIVFASGPDIMEVSSEAELEICLTSESYCKLTSDISMTKSMGVTGTTILDLNGKIIMASPSLKLKNGLIIIERGAKLIIEDSVGTGKISSGSADNPNIWAGVQVGKNSSEEKLAELIVNGGTIEGYYYGVVGNGTVHNTKITVNNGTIVGLNKSDSIGIYHPQIGEMTINGGTIKGGSGIEIRSGTVTINNGNIIGEAPSFTKVVNGSGSTTNGVGVAIAQHTTKNPINLTINGGDISGKYAFYEWNPHNNSRSDLDKINIYITGGNFKTTLEGGVAVYSQNFTNFISGGKFNTDVTEYLTENAQVTSKEIKDEINTHKGGKMVILIILVLLGVLVFGIIYKNKRKK